MLDKLITISQFLKVPVYVIRYALVGIIFFTVGSFGTRTYIRYTNSTKTVASVSATQKEILVELRKINDQNNADRKRVASVALVMIRSFKEFIAISRELADDDPQKLRSIADKEKRINELISDYLTEVLDYEHQPD